MDLIVPVVGKTWRSFAPVVPLYAQQFLAISEFSRMLLCSAAAPEVRSRAMQGEAQRSSALQQDVAHTSAFLLSFFQAVCTSGQAEHPHLQRTLAMCLGDYAAWFAR